MKERKRKRKGWRAHRKKRFESFPSLGGNNDVITGKLVNLFIRCR
jgi:hypothetical protein